MWDKICVILGGIGAFLELYTGKFSGILQGLVVFMVIDYISGVCAAAKSKELSSNVGFIGLMRKMIIMGMVIIAHTVDAYVVKEGQAVRTAVILFYLSNEGMSILENIVELGIKVPDKLKEVLEQLNSKQD